VPFAELAATEVVLMLLAAALLLLSYPQSAPNAYTDSAAPADKTEIKKEDATTSSALPAAPMPKVAADDATAATGESSSVIAEPFLPGAGIQPAAPPKAAIRGVRYETPREKLAWIGLSAVGHGAAVFDAYSTRRAISGGFGTESNPFLRPFSHSSTLYVATQVSPAVIDFVGHKMMTNRRPWVRKMWWVPQAAGAGVSFSAGVHNMSLVK
jgi:hypothetical protein